MARPRGSQLTLQTPHDLDFAETVCSYGFFLLAPAQWDRDRQRLHHCLAVGDRRVGIAVTHSSDAHRLKIACDATLSPAESKAVKQAVTRMLRLDMDVKRWHKLHRPAKKRGFGRLFRCPTLFEDMVRTITCCNVTWPNTVRMNQLLTEKVGGGAFPTPTQLAKQTPSRLKTRCKLGYRAERVVKLARSVDQGQLDLAWFEHADRATDELYDALLAIHGIGPYAANNLLQLLGHYDRVAIDSETYRHFRQTHSIPTPKTAPGLRKLHRKIERHYEPFAPYQFLAYWYELMHGYERTAGPAQGWPQAEPASFTGRAAK